MADSSGERARVWANSRSVSRHSRPGLWGHVSLGISPGRPGVPFTRRGCNSALEGRLGGKDEWRRPTAEIIFVTLVEGGRGDVSPGAKEGPVI